jgi:thiol-disulfide isomerase/thioredoxin
VRTTLVTVFLSATAALVYFGYRTLPGLVAPAEIPAVAQVVPAASRETTLLATLPDFTLPSLTGEPQSIRSWPGQAMIVNFWATWCPPCLREIPLLKAFKTRHDGTIQVVGIAVDQWDAVAAFAQDAEFNYPVLVGQSEAIDAAAAFGVDFVGLPFSVFVDASGRLVGVRTGELREEHLDEFADVIAALGADRMSPEEARLRLAGRM